LTPRPVPLIEDDDNPKPEETSMFTTSRNTSHFAVAADNGVGRKRALKRFAVAALLAGNLATVGLGASATGGAGTGKILPHAAGLSIIAINPQPLPPSHALPLPAINPQPLPPGE
jgi:hypothetical protein